MFVGHIEEILAYAWFDWKEWSEWSPCSNMGKKTRTRECPGVHCLDDGQGNGMLSNGTEIADCTVSTSYYILFEYQINEQYEIITQGQRFSKN